MREFTSAAEMRAHYREVQQRLNPPARPPAVFRMRISKLRSAPVPVQVTPSMSIRTTIVKTLADAYNLRVDDIKGTRRLRQFILPRHIAFYLCRKAGYSLIATGTFFNRDHATILHGVRRVQALINSDCAFKAMIEGFLSNIIDRHPDACFNVPSADGVVAVRKDSERSVQDPRP